MRFMALVVLVVLVACGERGGTGARTRQPLESRTPPLRVKMEDLHMLGGVPAGWQLSPPPGDPVAGRQAYADYGCPSCHHIAGENFGTGSNTGPQVGPDLTGMGAHHPAGYFAEAIMNPSVLLIDGPGYAGPDGKSVMPSYDSMTIAELADIVAFLQSQTSGQAAHDHAQHVAMGHVPPVAPLVPAPVPLPPGESRGAYISMVYDVPAEKLAAFQGWFSTEGRALMAKIPEVVGMETYVDTTRVAARIITALRFRDQAAMNAFMDSSDTTFGDKFDEFIGPHGHFELEFPPVYRVPALSGP
jgi:mono/diheme cytochrome c family protein